MRRCATTADPAVSKDSAVDQLYSRQLEATPELGSQIVKKCLEIVREDTRLGQQKRNADKMGLAILIRPVDDVLLFLVIIKNLTYHV